MSSKSRNRTSSSIRRSRSPRRKKSLSPGPRRRRGPIRGRRPPSHSNYDDERYIPKRPRSSPRNRSGTPTRHSPIRRRRTYSDSRDIPLDQERSSQQVIVRDGVRNRLRSEDRCVVDRPIFRGPDNEIIMDRDSLKKIVVKMRDPHPSVDDGIKRAIINPEDINIVRRAVASGYSRNYHGVNNDRMSGLTKHVSDWEQRPPPYDESNDHKGLVQYTSEGSRPIFERPEILNFGRKFESERERERGNSRSPAHSSRTHTSSERFRARESYFEERSESLRDYSRDGRPNKDSDSRAYDRSRDDRSRYEPSVRDYSRDRSDRYDERDDQRSFRRSPGRSTGRIRRRPYPRKRLDDYKQDRETSPETRELSLEMRGEVSPSRGRGRGLPFRGRGISSTRAFPRPRGIIMHPARPVRGEFLPPIPGRRWPFPPRIVGPVIRVIAPVIPGGPPVLPVRPPVIPGRRPVIPLPF